MTTLDYGLIVESVLAFCGLFVQHFLYPFAVSAAASALVVFIGVRRLKDYIRDRERKIEIGKLEDFWLPPDGTTNFNLVFGADWKGREKEVDPRFGYAQAYGVAELTDCLSTVFNGEAQIHPVVVNLNDKIPSHLFDENIVIFGGEASIAEFGVICRKLQLPYYQYRLDMQKRSFQSDSSECPDEVITSKVDGTKLFTDFGTVTRIINPTNQKLIILLNGNYGAGLLGSVLAISKNSGLLDDLDSKAKAQQMLIEVPNIVGNMIGRQHRVNNIRHWTSFNLPNDFITGECPLSVDGKD